MVNVPHRNQRPWRRAPPALVGPDGGWYRPAAFEHPAVMQVRLEPQGKQLTISGRRRVGELVQSLGILAGTVMVIRGDELLTDDEFVDDADSIELRAVISGGLA
jgi:sulfur carrier protein